MFNFFLTLMCYSVTQIEKNNNEKPNIIILNNKCE